MMKEETRVRGRENKNKAERGEKIEAGEGKGKKQTPTGEAGERREFK